MAHLEGDDADDDARGEVGQQHTRAGGVDADAGAQEQAGADGGAEAHHGQVANFESLAEVRVVGRVRVELLAQRGDLLLDLGREGRLLVGLVARERDERRDAAEELAAART